MNTFVGLLTSLMISFLVVGNCAAIEVAWGKKKKEPVATEADATAKYNKVTGKLSAVLPGSVEKNVKYIEAAAEDAKITIISKKADALTASLRGELADNRSYSIELGGKGFEATSIQIRVQPKGVDLKVFAGDESAARMLLEYIRRENGSSKSSRKKFLGLF